MDGIMFKFSYENASVLWEKVLSFIEFYSVWWNGMYI